MSSGIKKVLSLILTAVLALSLFASCGEIEYAVVSEGNQSSDGFTYTLYENGTAVISGTDSAADRIIVPATVDGYRVTGIADSAFEGNENVLYLKIDAAGIKIGEFAFSGCPRLTYADIGTPASLGRYAFYDCQNLTVCDGCETLTSVSAMTFLGCTSLCSVRLGSKLKSIGNEAFSNCASLPGITLPQSVESIGDSAFSYSAGLAYADVSSLRDIPKSCFEGCTALSEVVLSDKLSSISELAFRSCSSLYAVALPKSLKNVGENAFAVCDTLKVVNFAGSENAWTKIGFGEGNEAIASIRPYCNYKKPDKNSATGALPLADRGSLSGDFSRSGFRYSTYADGTAVITGADAAAAILNVPDTLEGHRVVGIAGSAFESDRVISTVNLGNTLEFIGEGAFYSCPSLRTVSGGSALKSIGYCAFDDTPYLNESHDEYVRLGSVLIKYKGENPSARIPSGIAYIADGAFLANYALTSVVLGENVVSLGNQAFSYCTALKYVSGPSVLTVGENCFASCQTLRSFDTGSDVAKIGSHAFADCYALRHFCPGTKLEDLRNNIFLSDMNIRIFCMPKSLTSLYSSAFTDCTSFMILYAGSEEEFRAALHEDSTFFISDMFTVFNYSFR